MKKLLSVLAVFVFLAGLAAVAHGAYRFVNANCHKYIRLR